MKASLQVTYFLMLMMAAHNLHFAYAKEEMKWAEYVLAWPNYLRSVTVAGRQEALLPSPRRGCPQASPGRSLGANPGYHSALHALWLKAKFVGKGSGQLLFSKSKQLWRIRYACTTPTHLPPVQEMLHLRATEAVTPWPKYLQSVPYYWEDAHCLFGAIHSSRKLYFIP